MIRVLIVEDDPMVAEFNRRYLAQIGGFVLVAMVRSAAEALTLLEKQAIDLILLDIFMPDMNGLDLLSQIRNIDRNVDVIVVSAACDNHSIRRALRYGVVDYLIKPFEFERFNAALSAYRDRAVFMRGQGSINQAELDQIILLKDQPLLSELPKGLDRNTLKIVWEHIQEGAENPFTTEEMAKRVGVSRVSMRKYLTFLMKMEILRMEVTFGSIGRPVYKYRCIQTDANFIKRFQ